MPEDLSAQAPLKTIVKTGVVAEYNGQFWGILYQDAGATCTAYGPIENAAISDPEYCKKPTDMTWNPANTHGFNPNYDELKKGRLIPVRVTTVFELNGRQPDKSQEIKKGDP